MVRSTVRSKPTLQLVLQGEARELTKRLDLGHIAYEVLDLPGPMVLRIAAADWPPIRAIAAECGYTRPEFFCQSDEHARDPFSLYWLRRMPAVPR